MKARSHCKNFFWVATDFPLAQDETIRTLCRQNFFTGNFLPNTSDMEENREIFDILITLVCCYGPAFGGTG